MLLYQKYLINYIKFHYLCLIPWTFSKGSYGHIGWEKMLLSTEIILLKYPVSSYLLIIDSN